MSKKFEELELDVIQWAYNKDLLSESNASKQLLKTISELGELADAFIKADDNEIEKEFGDVLVCLIVFANQLGIDPMDCLDRAYKKISKRKGKTVNGVFIKEKELTCPSVLVDIPDGMSPHDWLAQQGE